MDLSENRYWDENWDENVLARGRTDVRTGEARGGGEKGAAPGSVAPTPAPALGEQAREPRDPSVKVAEARLLFLVGPLHGRLAKGDCIF